MTGKPHTIDMVARRFGVSLRTLRFYEQRGLIAPTRDGKRRLYSEQDCVKVAVILKGKKLGFSLIEIDSIINSQISDRNRIVDIIKDFASVLSEDQLLDQITVLESKKNDVERAIQELSVANTLR